MQGECDAGTAQHAPWATSVRHWAGSFGKPRREAVEVESASARCCSLAQLLVLCYAPRSQRAMRAARMPTRAAHGDGRSPSDIRRLRRVPNTS